MKRPSNNGHSPSLCYFRAQLRRIVLRSSKRKHLSEAGQTTLEVGMAIALAIVLIVGTIGVWGWFNTTMVERYQEYNRTRHDAVRFVESDKFGDYSRYTPPDLSILSMDGSIDDPQPPDDPPPDSDCAEALNDALETANQLRQEVYALDQEIVAIATEIIRERMDLGMNVYAEVWYTDNPHGEFPHWWRILVQKMMDWLYGGSGYFDHTFHEVQDRLFDKINGYVPHDNYNFTFYESGNPENFDTTALLENYITPGVDLENSGLQKAEDRNGIAGQADALEEQAWEDYYDCSDSEPIIDPCQELCQFHLDDADEFTREAYEALGSGDFQGFSILMQQAQDSREQYDVCYDGC